MIRGTLGLMDAEAPNDGNVVVYSAAQGRGLWKSISEALLTGFTANQIPVGTATGGLAGSAALTFDGTTLALTGSATISTTLAVTGTSTFAAVNATSIGATTPGTGAFTTLSATAAATLTTASSGLTISKTTGTTVTVASTDVASVTTAGGYTSTVVTGTAPFTATSTTACPNLNASLLLGATWVAPGTIGSTTPSTGAFTTLTANGAITFTLTTDTTAQGNGAVLLSGGLSIAKSTTWAAASRWGLGSSILERSFFECAPVHADNTGLSVYGWDFNPSLSNANSYEGASIAGSVQTGKDVSTWYGFRAYNTTGSGTISATQYGFHCAALTKGATANYAFFSAGAGLIKFSDTTDASAVGTASTVLLGGLGVAKAAFIGGLVNIAGVATAANTTDSSSTITGSLITSGGLGVAKAAFIGTSATATAATLVAGTTVINGTVSDSGTTNSPNALVLDHLSSGTPGNGFGTQIVLRGKSTTTDGRDLGYMQATWVVATDASRTSRMALYCADTAVREFLRGEASGSAPMIGFLGTAAAVKQTSGANLTNNVTSGGTTDQIDDFTSLTVYATDAAAIRNDIYQLARKLKQVNDALRTYGLLT